MERDEGQAALRQKLLQLMGLWLISLDDEEDNEILLELLCSMSVYHSIKKANVSRNLTHSFNNPLEYYTDEHFHAEFRFEKPIFVRLHKCLRLPSTIRTPRSKSTCTSEIALLMLLYRISSPCTLVDMEKEFGGPYPVISEIIQEVADIIYQRFKDKIAFDIYHIRSNIDYWSQLINSKVGADLQRLWGFITVEEMFRPKRGGHRRCHGLKYQTITSPDGMIPHLFGSVDGSRCRHESTLLRRSNLLHLLSLHCNGYSIYGDYYYPFRPVLRPYRGNPLTEAQKDDNIKMAKLSITVEGGYKIVTSLWPALKFVPKQQVLKTPVAKIFMVATLLTNCHNCVYPNQVAQHFSAKIPQLEEYLYY